MKLFERRIALAEIVALAERDLFVLGGRAMDLRDIRVIERRERLRLTRESRKPIGIALRVSDRAAR